MYNTKILHKQKMKANMTTNTKNIYKYEDKNMDEY